MASCYFGAKRAIQSSKSRELKNQQICVLLFGGDWDLPFKKMCTLTSTPGNCLQERTDGLAEQFTSPCGPVPKCTGCLVEHLVKFLGGSTGFYATHKTQWSILEEPETQGELLIPKPGQQPKVGESEREASVKSAHWKLLLQAGDFHLCFLPSLGLPTMFVLVQQDSVLEGNVIKKGSGWCRQKVLPTLNQSSQTALITHLLHWKSPLFPTGVFCQLVLMEWSPLSTDPARGSYTSTVLLAS